MRALLAVGLLVLSMALVVLLREGSSGGPEAPRTRAVPSASLEEARRVELEPAAGEARRRDGDPSPAAAGAPADVRTGPEPGTLRGEVVDLAGRAVPGVDVLLLPSKGERRTRSASDGTFEFEGVTPGELQLATRPNPGAVSASVVDLELADGQSLVGLTLVVVPTKTLEGWVRGPLGEGLAGVPIYFHDQYDASSPLIEWVDQTVKATTDDQGRFRVENLPCVEFEAAAHPDRHEALFHTIAADARTVELRATTTFEDVELFGRVVDAMGGPVPGAALTFRGLQRHGKETTDADGGFRFRSRASRDADWIGDPCVTVCARGYASTRFVLSLDEILAGPLELVVEAERLFEGFVVDEFGERIDAYVDFWTVGLDDLFDDPVRACDHDEPNCTAENGFRAHRLGEGPYDVLVRRRGSLHHSRHVLTADGSPFVLAPTDPAESLVLFEITARDAETGEPITRFQRGVYDGGGGSSSGREWPDGIATDWERGPATLRVEVKADGYCGVEFPERHYETGLYRLEASLVPARSLRLRFVEADGRPVRGARVGVPGWPEDGTDHGRGHRPPRSARGTTGLDGRCRIRFAPAQAGSVLVRREETSPWIEIALPDPDVGGERTLVLDAR
ncbi:MAG: carboxypeptidase-like regulatory domain-containing protein [Planctomycetota bacterium]